MNGAGPRTLDLRTGPAEDAAERALAAFDALAPGEVLPLLGSDALLRVLETLRSLRRGRFEWSPAGREGDAFRVDVEKRAAGAPDLRGVNEVLAWDHDRLEAIEEGAFEALSSGKDSEAARLFALFRFGLERHIAFEEDLLFPAVEKGLGFPPNAGPTAVMRAEHRQILTLLGLIADALASGDSTRTSTGRRSLLEVLGAHNQKEERVLYPMADRTLGSEGADALVARIQAHGRGTTAPRSTRLGPD